MKGCQYLMNPKGIRKKRTTTTKNQIRTEELHYKMADLNPITSTSEMQMSKAVKLKTRDYQSRFFKMTVYK